MKHAEIVFAMLVAVGLLAGCATEEKPSGFVRGDLPGTAWRMVSLDDEHGTMQTFDYAEITLGFDDQGRVAGSGGCNRYFGAIATSADGKLSIGPLGSTQMACEDVPSDREFRFLRALESCDIATGTEGHLELLSSDGTVRVVFEQAADVETGTP